MPPPGARLVGGEGAVASTHVAAGDALIRCTVAPDEAVTDGAVVLADDGAVTGAALVIVGAATTRDGARTVGAGLLGALVVGDAATKPFLPRLAEPAGSSALPNGLPFGNRALPTWAAVLLCGLDGAAGRGRKGLASGAVGTGGPGENEHVTAGEAVGTRGLGAPRIAHAVHPAEGQPRGGLIQEAIVPAVDPAALRLPWRDLAGLAEGPSGVLDAAPDLAPRLRLLTDVAVVAEAIVFADIGGADPGLASRPSLLAGLVADARGRLPSLSRAEAGVTQGRAITARPAARDARPAHQIADLSQVALPIDLAAGDAADFILGVAEKPAVAIRVPIAGAIRMTPAVALGADLAMLPGFAGSVAGADAVSGPGVARPILVPIVEVDALLVAVAERAQYGFIGARGAGERREPGDERKEGERL